jgi:hypothetical protein
MRLLRDIVITVVGGLLTAAVLFCLTAPTILWLGPVGRPDGTDFVEDWGGYDPWTGDFRPRTWTWTDPTGHQLERILGPNDYWKRQAIPLPVGFAIGSIVTLGVIAARRSRGTPSSPAVSEQHAGAAP